MMFDLLVRPLAGAILEAADEAAEEIASDATTAVADVFERMAEAGAAAGDELTERTESLFEAVASFASDALRPSLEDSLFAVEEAMGALAGAQEAAAGVLEAWSSAMEAAVALAPPLNWARRIVDTIDALLGAMNLGL